MKINILSGAAAALATAVGLFGDARHVWPQHTGKYVAIRTGMRFAFW